VNLPHHDRNAIQRIEQLWCRTIELNRYGLCCIPFWLPGLALGQVVTTGTEMLTIRPGQLQTAVKAWDGYGSLRGTPGTRS
jgi:hypothetical protein